MDDRPLHDKDPRWKQEVLKDFRACNYYVSLEKSLIYAEEILPAIRDFRPTEKDRANIYYTIACSAYGVLEKGGVFRQREWDLFFQYLDIYISNCETAAQNSGLSGFYPANAKTLLSDALELLCRHEAEGPEEKARYWCLRFAAIPAPEWEYDLVLTVLSEKIFSERINFDRKGHVANTRALCQVYLSITEAAVERYWPGRTQVMNLMSDLAYFQGGEAGESEALEWARRALAENPEDRFASVRRKFIEERQVVRHRIRRFTHDTENTLAGIQNRLEYLLERPTDKGGVKGGPLELSLQTLRRELRRLHGANRFIQEKEAEPEEIDPVMFVREAVSPFAEKVDLSLFPEKTDRQWYTDPDYLILALDNLLKNAMEAFERRKIPRPDRRIRVLVEPAEGRIVVEDNAGGVDPTIKDQMFEPYVSSKAIRQETGLGLTSARLAAQKLNGEVRFPEEQPEDGARFEIHIPQRR